MKTAGHPNYLLLLLLAFGLVLGPVVQAQETPSAAPAVAPAPDQPQVSPAPPAPPPAQVAESTEETKPGAAPEAAKEPAAAVAADKPADATIAATPEPEKPADQPAKKTRSRRSNSNERVSFGSNSTLAADENAQAVVSIFGSSTSAGEVNDAVVSVIGSSRVTGGTVGDAVVSVMGNTYVNGHVKGEVVTVLGNVEFGPDAIVDGEVVCVGGQVTRDAKAVIKGDVQNIAIAGQHFDFTGLTTWVTECLLYARPLAFNSHLLWAWCIALVFLGFYALIALIAPAGVLKCVETLEQRPGSSLLAALLTLLLTPVAYILLLITLALAIGFVLIPVFSLGLFFAAIFGKIVMLAWLGRRITKLFGDGPLAHPVFGVLIGGVIILGLYTIPVVGFITYKLLGFIGLGVVVYTLILQFKASRPPKPVVPAATHAPVFSAVAGVVPAAVGATGEVPPMVSAVLPVISAVTLPRAGFWIRVAAAVLDLILVGILCGFLGHLWHGFGSAFPFWFALYHVIMWATKGTTIGGIICNLKVVRLDDRPIDWGVAIVRSLGSFLSLCIAGLGFIWVAFDDEKQSWHDKIAGTTIVRVPKGTPLL